MNIPIVLLISLMGCNAEACEGAPEWELLTLLEYVASQSFFGCDVCQQAYHLLNLHIVHGGGINQRHYQYLNDRCSIENGSA